MTEKDILNTRGAERPRAAGDCNGVADLFAEGGDEAVSVEITAQSCRWPS